MDIIFTIMAVFMGVTAARGFAKDRKDRIYSRVRINMERHKLAAARCFTKYPPPPGSLVVFFQDVRRMVYTP